MEYSRGNKISLCQSLYKYYSRLKVNIPRDRSRAISGLERRLIHSFGVHGGFGVLEEEKDPAWLRRTLLWRRGEDVASLARIDFEQDHEYGILNPPTWSWMAYHGGIDYMDPPSDAIEWDVNDVISPWQTGTRHSNYPVSSGIDSIYLSVIARNLRQFDSSSDAHLIFDDPVHTDRSPEKVRCVVLGRLKDQGKAEEDGVHFVMLVDPRTPETSNKSFRYKRVGVGCMPKYYIDLDGPGTIVKVC